MDKKTIVMNLDISFFFFGQCDMDFNKALEAGDVLYISDVMASLFVLMDSYDGSQKWLDNFQDKYPVLFALYEGFSALKDVIMDIAGVFKPLVDEINSLDTADFLEIGNSIKQIFSGLSPTIEPAWQAISRLVSDIFPLLKNTFVSLAPFVAEGFGILASLLGTIIEAFTWVINLVADFIEENQEFQRKIQEFRIRDPTKETGGNEHDQNYIHGSWKHGFRKKCTWRLYVHTGTSRERDRTL